MKRGIALAVLHCALVLSVAGKYAWDRETLPRKWMRSTPVDPILPIRGRYLALRLSDARVSPPHGIVAYFIPEHAPDPSRLNPGEELWVEVSVPRAGPLRPIRLGIKRDGVLTPLALN